LVLDTETTGLEDGAEIVQLGLLAPDGRVLLETLIRPARAIPVDAAAIHGITDAAVAGAPTFPQIYSSLLEACGDKRIVAYNATLIGLCWTALAIGPAWFPSEITGSVPWSATRHAAATGVRFTETIGGIPCRVPDTGPAATVVRCSIWWPGWPIVPTRHTTQEHPASAER